MTNQQVLFWTDRRLVASVMVILTLLTVIVADVLQAQKADPCAIHLKRAEDKVAKAKTRIMVGDIGLRVSAVDDITDYLTCRAASE